MENAKKAYDELGYTSPANPCDAVEYNIYDCKHKVECALYKLDGNEETEGVPHNPCLHIS